MNGCTHVRMYACMFVCMCYRDILTDIPEYNLFKTFHKSLKKFDEKVKLPCSKCYHELIIDCRFKFCLC